MVLSILPGVAALPVIFLAPVIASSVLLPATTLPPVSWPLAQVFLEG